MRHADDKSDDAHAAPAEDHENESETNDDRLTAEEAADLAECLVEERTEVKTCPTRGGTRVAGVDRPYARSIAEDVADRIEGATVYVTEEQRGPTVADAAGRGKTAAPVEVAVISLDDGEVAVYPGGQRVELRDADECDSDVLSITIDGDERTISRDVAVDAIRRAGLTLIAGDVASGERGEPHVQDLVDAGAISAEALIEAGDDR